MTSPGTGPDTRRLLSGGGGQRGSSQSAINALSINFLPHIATLVLDNVNHVTMKRAHGRMLLCGYVLTISAITSRGDLTAKCAIDIFIGYSTDERQSAHPRTGCHERATRAARSSPAPTQLHRTRRLVIRTHAQVSNERRTKRANKCAPRKAPLARHPVQRYQ